MSNACAVLTLAFRREGSVWTGECLELGTATYGHSLEQVHHELAELIQLDIDTLEDIGERERFFREHHIATYQDRAALPRTVCPDIPVDEATFFHPHSVCI